MGKELFDNIPSKVSDLLSDVKNGLYDERLSNRIYHAVVISG